MKNVDDMETEYRRDRTGHVPTRLEQQQATGKKADSGKPDLSLVAPEAIIELARVLTFGATKYGAHNWRGGINESRILAALLRHTLAYASGEDTDPETGISHIAHAMCNCMFLLAQHPKRPDLDDRYKAPS